MGPCLSPTASSPSKRAVPMVAAWAISHGNKLYQTTV